MQSSTPTSPRKPTQLESLAAGMVAGAVEGLVTYPTEYLKTRAQLSTPAPATAGVSFAYSPPPFSSGGSVATSAVLAHPPRSNNSILSVLVDTLKTRGIGGLYSGAGALVVGNGVKAGVRFLTYDSFKEMLRDRDGKLTPGRTMVAGLCAGTAEAIIAVTPSETIKTKLIQDAARAKPLYKGTLSGTLAICKSEGLAGIYRGLAPTIAKQSANSAVRFTSYSWLQSRALELIRPASGKLNAGQTFGVGAAAGFITVYATMPFDVVKTRMQQANNPYLSSLDCVARIIRYEGPRALWGGTTPRLVRLMMSGGIIFTVYEEVMGVFRRVSP